MSGATLTEVLTAAGTSVLSPWLVPPEKSEATLSDVVIYDRLEPGHITAGALVLGVGLDLAEMVAMVEYAAGRGAHAVVLRGGLELREALLATVATQGVALLGMSAGTSWVRMASLLRNAVSTTGGHLAHGESTPTQHDLTAVATSLASAVNGSVLIFNPQQELLASSRLASDDDPVRHQAVLDQHGPAAYRDHLRERGVYKELWSSDDVVSVPPVPELGARRRKAVVVRAGDEILGSIWIAEGPEPLAADTDAVLRAAAAAASGHLVWLQARAQTEARFGEGLVADLLSGGADVRAVATWLGVSADQACASLMLSVPDPTTHRRLVSLVAMHFSAFRHRVLTLVAQGCVEVVLCDLPSGGVHRAGVADVVERVARSLGIPVLAALGTTEPSLSGLPVSHRRAEAVLAVLRRAHPDRTRLASVEDVRTELQLDRLLSLLAEQPEMREGPARSLLDHDVAHGTDLSTSVLALLDAFGNVAQAAAEIHVHPNTLRHRVRRACELSGLDLDSPGQRLVTHLQLRAWRLADRT
jgi:hypothetical protein